MKIILGLLALLLVGCQYDTADTNVEKFSSLTLSIAPTRTSLGEKAGNVYPVSWSEGDCIVANGLRSLEAKIDAENKSRATFDFSRILFYPCSITYPSTGGFYSSGVVFAAEQNYVEGSTESGVLPMCGYVANASEGVMLKHLAAVLRFAVKADEEGVVLSKIVITSSTAKLSGEFNVDCAKATITPKSSSGNTVTYNLPANFTLSTTEDSIFYIALPAGSIGDCTVEFIEQSGAKMEASLSERTLTAGVVREFNSLTYKRGATCVLPSFGKDNDRFDIDVAVSGYVRDSSGNGISGVAVSDGFMVAVTDENGYYSLLCSQDVWYIYLSLPSEYEVPINEHGQPCFYQKFSQDRSTYDFVLEPLENGKENKFALFVLTDLHVSTSYRRARFSEEAVPSIRRHLSNEVPANMPCYGITLGDLISNSSTKDTSEERVHVRELLSKDVIGFPTFQVMGNHDNTYCDAQNPIYADGSSSTFDLKAQRAHEDMYGPINYSFNRGDVHIIGMRNIIYTANNGNSSYKVGFTAEQWKWLQQDLALVPKDKMVVLCCHIKLNGETTDYIPEVTALLGEYKEAHVFTGHSHIQRKYPTSGSTKKVFEHNLAAIAGASWYCKMCEDGCPIGYNVYIGEGATFSDWYFMSFNKGTDTRPQQMRLYRGDAITGAAAPSAPGTDDNPEGVKGFYKFNFADNVLLANVYNADKLWTIKVYEDNVYSGNMTLLPNTNYSMSTLIGDGSETSPFRFADGVETGQDLYTAGLLMGIQSRYKNGEPLGNCWSNNYHMYKYALKNKNAEIKVVAIDRFGNEYTETKITEGTDYLLTSGDYKTDDAIK